MREQRFNPFPGLRSFEPDEEHLFFGREKQIDELLRRLRLTRFVTVFGASGSGKSSLVRSGVIPALHSGYMARAGSSWRIGLMRPGADPIGNLAAALDEPEVVGAGAAAADMGRPLLEATLRRSALGLTHAVRDAHLDAADNVLLVIDQFEELFRFKQARATVEARDEAVAFVRLLVEAARNETTRIYVVLTMRSEFTGQCTQFPGLAEAVNEGQYLVPRLTRDELKLAMTGPVAVAGGEIAPRLVTRLLNDVGDDPDQLPILQHALMRTWDFWAQQGATAGPIDLLHYEAIGGMHDALSLHADEAYEELTTDGDRHIAERMFKALVETTPQAGGVRRPCRVDELCDVAGVGRDAMAPVIERFRMSGRSFLMPPSHTPLSDSTIVDLSHESLMRLWQRLITWTNEEARSADVYRRLTEAAGRYERNEAALLRDPELQLAVNWRDTGHPTRAWAARYDPAFDRAMAFLAQSQKTRDQEIDERRRLRRQKIVVARTAAAVLFVLCVLAGVSLIFALNARNEALAARTEAETQRRAAVDEAAKARAAEVEAVRQRQLALEQEGKARDASLQAVEEQRRAEREKSNAEGAAQVAEQQQQEAQRERANAEQQRLEAVKQQQAAITAAGTADAAKRAAEAAAAQATQAEKIAEAARDEQRRLQYLALARALAGEATRRFDASDVPVLLARQAYNLASRYGGAPESPEIATALRRSLENLPEGGVRAFLGHNDAVRAVAISPDGARLATASDDGQVRLFDMRDPARPPTVVGALGSPVRSVAFDKPGTRLAVGTFDGRIHVWTLAPSPQSPRLVKSWAAHDQAVSGLAFDGRQALVSVGLDGQHSLWQPETFMPDKDPTGRQPYRLVAAALNRDGDRLAAASDGGGVLIWNLVAQSAQPVVLGSGLRTTAVAFSPDDRWLAAGTATGQVLYWDLARPAEPIKEAAVHRASVTALQFAGGRLASTSLDGDVKVWTATPQALDAQPLVLEHGAWVWALAFTPSGDTLLSAGADRRVRAWPTSARALAEEACRRVSRNLTQAEWQLYLADVPYTSTCPTTAGRSGR